MHSLFRALLVRLPSSSTHSCHVRWLSRGRQREGRDEAAIHHTHGETKQLFLKVQSQSNGRPTRERTNADSELGQSNELCARAPDKKLTHPIGKREVGMGGGETGESWLVSANREKTGSWIVSVWLTRPNREKVIGLVSQRRDLLLPSDKLCARRFSLARFCVVDMQLGNGRKLVIGCWARS